MSEKDSTKLNGTEDGHAHVRFYKLLEVAYNCANNGYYERAGQVAAEAAKHHDEVSTDSSVSE
jgi:hypothetical protein